MSHTLLQHLPASMLEAVTSLPVPEQPVVLLTRHSLRQLAVANGFASYKLPLTPAGRTLALEWGAWLARNSHWQCTACISSPIQRCVDTASLMLQGWNSGFAPDAAGLVTSSQVIEQHALLVEPGSFILDIAQAGPYFKQYGALHFINCFLRQQLPGMKLPLQGAQDILRLLFERLPDYRHHSAGNLLLAVSHDTILAALFAIMQGHTEVTPDDWPAMMEGAFLWFEGDCFDTATVHWVWRGQQRQFNPARGLIF